MRNWKRERERGARMQIERRVRPGRRGAVEDGALAERVPWVTGCIFYKTTRNRQIAYVYSTRAGLGRSTRKTLGRYGLFDTMGRVIVATCHTRTRCA